MAAVRIAGIPACLVFEHAGTARSTGICMAKIRRPCRLRASQFTANMCRF